MRRCGASSFCDPCDDGVGEALDGVGDVEELGIGAIAFGLMFEGDGETSENEALCDPEFFCGTEVLPSDCLDGLFDTILQIQAHSVLSFQERSSTWQHWLRRRKD